MSSLWDTIQAFILKYKLGKNPDVKIFKSFSNIIYARCTNKNLIVHYKNGRKSCYILPIIKIKRRLYSNDTTGVPYEPRLINHKIFDTYFNLEDQIIR